MAFTRPKAAQIDFDITNITDPLIRLNSGQSGANDKDVGIVIERGDDTNVAVLYDESADQFVLVNTTEDGSTSGNVTISSYAGLQANAIVYGSLNDGTTTLTATVAELNYVDGVTSNIQTQIDNISSSFTLAADSGSNDTFTTGQTLTISGGTGIDTTVSDNNISIAIDSTVATQSYVTTQISNLVDSAPAALDTLNELAAALGDDASFSTTVTNSIAAKLPLAGGTMTGVIAGFESTGIDDNASSTAVTIDSSGNVTTTGDMFIDRDGGTVAAWLNIDATNGYQTGVRLLTAGVKRWEIGTHEASALEDFVLRSYNDAGGGAVETMYITRSNSQVAFVGNVVGTNAAGPALMNEAATSTNPTLVPNKADLDTGIGWASANTLTAVTGGSERMRIDSSGNVGIGTTSPARNLTVNGSIQFASGGVIEAGTTTLNTYIAAVEGASGRWVFATNGSERMRIDSSGNVGIGTTAPSSRLEISSAGDNTNVIVMSQGAGYKNSIQNLHSGSASNARMSFFVHDSSTTQANVMSLLGNGNVGIGTTAPSNKLDVSGDIGVLAQNEVRFYDTDSSNYVSFRSAATVASNIVWTLPNSDGTADQVLKTNGAGTLSWADQSGDGGGGGSSYPNSTITTLPGTEGTYDLAKNGAQTITETPFEAGGTDAFGVNLGTVFSLMDPVGSVQDSTGTGLDLGTL